MAENVVDPLMQPEIILTENENLNLPQNFNYGNIYHYLVESINKVCCHDDYDDEEYGDEDESIEKVTSKPFKKGTWLLKNGFVHDPQDNEDENN